MAVLTQPRATNTDPRDKIAVASGKIHAGRRVDVLPPRTYGKQR